MTIGSHLYRGDRFVYLERNAFTPVVHLAQNHLVQKRPLSAKLFRAKFNHPKVQLAQNSVL